MNDKLRHCIVDIFVETSYIKHDKSLLRALLPNSEGDVGSETSEDDGNRSGSSSGEEEKEGLVDVPLLIIVLMKKRTMVRIRWLNMTN